jgi:hypothetical protein
MSKRTLAVLICAIALVVSHGAGSRLLGADELTSREATPSPADSILGVSGADAVLSHAPLPVLVGDEISSYRNDVFGSLLPPPITTYLPLAIRSWQFGIWYTIGGRITYENGLPAQGFRVARQPDGTWATTDGAGHFVLQVVPAGVYTVSPTTPDHLYIPAERSVTVPPHAADVDFTARADAHVLIEVGSEGVGCPQKINCWADVDRVVYWFFSRPEGCMPMGIGDPDPYSIMWSYGQGNVQVDMSAQPGDIIEVYGSCAYDLGAHLMMIVSPSRPYFISAL